MFFFQCTTLQRQPLGKMQWSLYIWCWFSLHWGQLRHFLEQNFLRWVVEVRSYPSPKGLGDFSNQQHMGNMKRKIKKEENSKKGKRDLHLSWTRYFFAEGSVLCLGLNPPHLPVADLIHGFCINSCARPDKHLSFSFPKHLPPIWNVCHSHQKAVAQFWLVRNVEQDVCYREGSAKLSFSKGTMEEGGLLFYAWCIWNDPQ